jgi:hypothetical protein
MDWYWLMWGHPCGDDAENYLVPQQYWKRWLEIGSRFEKNPSLFYGRHEKQVCKTMDLDSLYISTLHVFFSWMKN